MGLEKVPGDLSVRSLTSNVNAYKLVTLYALYIHAKPFSLVLWLLRFSLSRAFHNAACPFKAHSRLTYWRLWLCSSLTSKSLLIAFLLIDHSNSFACPLLQTLHGIREGSMWQDVPPSLQMKQCHLFLLFGLSLVILWLVFCLNIYSILTVT